MSQRQVGVKSSVNGRRGGGGGRVVNKKEAYVRERVDVARPSAASRLEEDLRNTFTMRWRFTAELNKLQVQVGSDTDQSEP